MYEVDRRPTAFAWKLFLLLSSTPVALGVVPLPGSLSDQPSIFGQTAAAAIWMGCLVSLVGLVWPGRTSNGLYIEQCGLTFISVGCGMYAIALLGVPRFSDALLAFGMSGGIAVAAAVQNWFIRRHRRARRGEQSGR